jgi:hypothetical protein
MPDDEFEEYSDYPRNPAVEALALLPTLAEATDAARDERVRERLIAGMEMALFIAKNLSKLPVEH